MKSIHLVCFLISFLSLSAQPPAVPEYPKGYFRYPLGIPPRLNANFGEMRPNHFHMGLDLFTQRKENLPVYAAADGYVARVKIEPGGFGHAIYLNHPNGFTTLYAHMNDFMPALQAYLVQKQYEAESWNIELNIPSELFPVKKGQFIGYSGNTGGSMGPHVHFEIRETGSEKCVNPLLFGFPIADNVPPDLLRLALYDRNIGFYEQVPIMIPLKKYGNEYTATIPVSVYTDKLSIALQATDRMSGVPNANGIFSTRLFMDDSLVGGFDMNRIGYDETRYLNAHINYRTRNSGGPYLQNIFPLPGDSLEIYHPVPPNRFLSLGDTLQHQMRLEVSDPYGNRSVLRFSLKRKEKENPVINREVNVMLPGEINVYETNDLQLYLPENCLYDSIHFHYVKTSTGTAFSPVHQLHNPDVPLHAYFTVRIKPDKVIPYQLRDRLIIKQMSKGEVRVRKASWELGWYGASFRDFGSFQLVADNQAPRIVPIGFKNGSVVSKLRSLQVLVSDDNDDIRNFRAELDGKWLMFSQKGNLYTYIFDVHCPPGHHELKFIAMDEAGNETTQTFSIIR